MEPDNLPFLRDLCVSYSNLGSIYTELNQLAEADEAYERLLDLSKRKQNGIQRTSKPQLMWRLRASGLGSLRLGEQCHCRHGVTGRVSPDL